MMRALVVVMALCSSSAIAQTFPFAGVLETADGRVDGLVDIELAILAGDGTPLWTESQAAVVVVDGVFAIDVGASAALPAVMPSQATLALTIDDDALPPVPLARLIAASGAASADRATSSATTNTLAGSGAADVATRTALASAGGPAVDFSNIAGVPASVRDDDQGTDLTSTSGDFVVSARVLSLGTVSGARLGASTVSGSSLAVGRTQVAANAVTGAKMLDGSLARISLADDVTAREVKTVPIFIQTAACGTGFTTSGACVPPSCGLGRQIECSGIGCSSPSPLALRQCFNAKVGELVVDQ